MVKHVDILGSVEVSDNAPYGVHTARALQVSPVGNYRSVAAYPRWIAAILNIKRAMARAQAEQNYLDPMIAQAIDKAVGYLLTNLNAEVFPVHALAGGGCISLHMNVNEAIAYYAEELSGWTGARYERVHPNDHVNLFQSTNDVLPSASQIAAIVAAEEFRSAGIALSQSLGGLRERLGSTPFLSRTCLQDAVATEFGDLAGAWQAGVARCLSKVDKSLEGLRALPLTGTMVGKGDDFPDRLREPLIRELRVASGVDELSIADNLFDAAQNPDEILRFFGELVLYSRTLIKLSRDLRLLASGPEGGFGEMILPAVLCGSSTMPGKINPVVPEFVMQCCFQVIGLHAAAAQAIEHGELHLNIWEGLVITNLLDSLTLLEQASVALSEHCIKGASLNEERCRENAGALSASIMDLKAKVGYAEVAEMIGSADGDYMALKDEIARRLNSSP